ncbi:hypothetical protein BaRGS_00005006, partial [Batillaria attramentaria]
EENGPTEGSKMTLPERLQQPVVRTTLKCVGNLVDLHVGMRVYFVRRRREEGKGRSRSDFDSS